MKRKRKEYQEEGRERKGKKKKGEEKERKGKGRKGKEGEEKERRGKRKGRKGEGKGKGRKRKCPHGLHPGQISMYIRTVVIHVEHLQENKIFFLFFSFSP